MFILHAYKLFTENVDIVVMYRHDFICLPTMAHQHCRKKIKHVLLSRGHNVTLQYTCPALTNKFRIL
jgi:hypothetical protein